MHMNDTNFKIEKIRCECPTSDPLLIKYHDKEWGVPIKNDRKIFEFLVLESAQAGLSWNTVLRKREGYKKAFAVFDPEKVAQFTKQDVAWLIKNPPMPQAGSQMVKSRVFLGSGYIVCLI